jgi:hypothetical protein
MALFIAADEPLPVIDWHESALQTTDLWSPGNQHRTTLDCD